MIAAFGNSYAGHVIRRRSWRSLRSFWPCSCRCLIRREDRSLRQLPNRIHPQCRSHTQIRRSWRNLYAKRRHPFSSDQVFFVPTGPVFSCEFSNNWGSFQTSSYCSVMRNLQPRGNPRYGMTSGAHSKRCDACKGWKKSGASENCSPVNKGTDLFSTTKIVYQ